MCRELARKPRASRMPWTCPIDQKTPENPGPAFIRRARAGTDAKAPIAAKPSVPTPCCSRTGIDGGPRADDAATCPDAGGRAWCSRVGSA